jgi:apolipoprotein N-acyltransferase
VKRWALRLWPWLAAITSGILGAAAFPLFDQSWLIWIALVPLILAVLFSGEHVRRRPLHDLALGYVCGLTFFWICFFWMTTVTALGWFVLQFYLALYFAVWTCFCGMMRPQQKGIAVTDKWSAMLADAKPAPPAAASPWLSSAHNLFFAFSLASGWVALEWTRGWLMSGFGWNGLGVALHATWPMIQMAEWTGVAGVTFLVVFCNAVLAATVRRLWQESRVRIMRPHFDLTLTLVGLVAVFALGLRAVQTRPAARPLRVALVQANVSREQKFDLRFKQNIFYKFDRLSTVALSSLGNIDLLIWPESAMAAPVLEDRETIDFVTHVSESNHTDLLLGAIDEEPQRVYNAALLFRPGVDPQIYRKVHLVPFGEYIPFRHSFPLFAEIAGDQVPEDFDAGDEFTVFDLSGDRGRVAPLICFEDTIGELTRRFVLAGADLLVTVTNDGWFKYSAGSQQHLANAVFRSVETRRPMVRAANTGVTCFVNDLGRVTQILRDDRGSTFEEGTLAGEINIATDPAMTFYARHGEVFAKICAAVAGVILLTRLFVIMKLKRGL